MPDWRDSSAYEPLLEADRSLFAWEWLRRSPAYRTAARPGLEVRYGLDPALPGPSPERFGLHRFEPPGSAVPEARPIWCARRHPLVLSARAEPSPPGRDSFWLARVGHYATLAAVPGGERLLLSNGYRTIRLNLHGTSLLGGPVRLGFQLSGITGAKAMLPILRRFLSLATYGGFSRSLYPHDPRARRRVLLLRTYDALQEGADQRTIAGELLSGSAAETRWRLDSPSLRSQVQRLVRTARSMGARGFWDLLL